MFSCKFCQIFRRPFSKNICKQLLHSNFFIAYEKAAREQRMRAEISQVKKETSFYLENVEKGKAIKAMQERRKRKSHGTNLEVSLTNKFFR